MTTVPVFSGTPDKISGEWCNILEGATGRHNFFIGYEFWNFLPFLYEITEDVVDAL
jgi:hypothetical protein